MKHSLVQKWGNSLGIRIPIDFAKRMNLHPGSAVLLDIDKDNKLIVSPPRYDLDTMLKQITPKNRHHAQFDDTQKGNEEW
jgi:antitoxin MazE